MRRKLSFVGLFSLIFFLGTLSSNAQTVYDVSGPSPFSSSNFLFTGGPTTTTGFVNWHQYNSGGTANTWSAPYTLPFVFEFFGDTVTHFIVSKNYLLSFDTALANTAVNTNINDNSALPDPNLPNNTIAGFWDNFANGTASLGTNDNVWIGVFGTAPNRQLFIKNFSMETGGRGFSYGHWMLEETTNNIYFIDVYMGGTAGSMTIGVQKDATTAFQVAGSPNILPIVTSTAWTALEYYTFDPRQLVPNDAGVSSIDNPSAPFSTGSQMVNATITNFGTSNLTSATVNWSVNGVTQTPFSYTGNLATNATASVALGMFNFTGISTIQVWTSNPNSVADNFTANDTATVTLYPSLSGAYTVNSAIATGGTNFQSFSDLANSINQGGVSGPVTVSVAAGTYNDQFSIGTITGSSSINTIEIDGGGAATLTHDKSIRNSTVTLEGASYLTIKNMTIAATGTATDSWGIQLLDSAHHITIDSNTISVPVGTTTDIAGIIGSDSEVSDATQGNNAFDITISNNTIDGGERGISMYGSFTATARNQNIVVDNNTFTNNYGYGIYLVGYNNVTISDNTAEASATFGDGCYVSDLENFTISGNFFKGPDLGFDADDLNFDNTPVGRSSIVNNMFIGGDDAFYLDDVEDIDIFHNSTYAEDYGMYINDPVGLDIRNNIFFSNSDYAFYCLDNVPFTAINYNVYNSNGTNLANFGGIIYADLPAFITGQPTYNANSVEGDPLYVNNLTDLHCIGALAGDIGDNSAGITVDIDGDPRPLAPSITVDIGADEFLAPACAVPSNLTDSGATLTSVFVNWTENGTATNWQISYGPSPSAAGAGTLTLTSTQPTQITALSPSTTYDFYVRAVCGPNDTSAWSPIGSFSTLNGVPWSDNLEGFSNGPANQNGWTKVRTANPQWTADNGGTPSGATGPTVDHTLGTAAGIYVFLETSGGALGNRDTLTSPSIVVGAGQAFLNLEYWYHMAGASMGQMQVWIESAGVWDSVTTYVGAQQAGIADPWLPAAHILTGYAGQTITVNFIGERGSSFTGDMAIDDISVSVAPPDNIGITSIVRPSSGCGFTTTDTVEVVITNFGAAAQTGFNVGYSLNGVAITPETVTASLGVGMSMNYTFSTPANLAAAGDYDIDAYTLLTGDSDATNDTSSTTVTSIPTVSSFPYSESFEAGAAGWRVTGTTTFELGAPINTIIDTASDGTQAWVTDLDGPYVVNESGAVSSPCFDFSGISNPHIELDIWWDAETSWDGAVLQSSIDGGATWQKVGFNGDTVNWYNDNSISGLSSIEPSQEGWTGSPGSLGWVTARRALTGLGGQPSVQLRIAFGSDGSVVDEGFAFDNINIYEVYAVPFAEDFEDFSNGRANQNDWDNRNAVDPDWTADNGGTPSSGTGPDVDHTLGTSAGRYIYLETSGGSLGARDTLSSPSIIVDASQTTLSLDYWYHMAGAAMGQMQVWVESQGIWDSVTTYIGAQQNNTSDPWLSASHILTGYAGQSVTLHFIGEDGTSFTSDMAVDDVSLTVAPPDNIGITSIVRPTSGCGLSSTDSVEVVITNFGAAAQTGFNVGYSLNGVAITPETVTASLGVGMSMNYTFSTTANLAASGDYNIDAYTLLTGDSDASNDSSSTTVSSISVVSSFPYAESFEAGAAGWRVTGFTTFELGSPVNTIIDTASDGTQAWVTDLDGLYVVNESGAVSSPCFDFTGINNPTIELDIWYDAETSWDGAVLQSSIDGGATWQKVGANGDTVNWFNDNSITGLSSIEPSQEGWTGSPGSLGWITAKRALDSLGGQPSVQLRIAFGSDGSVVDEGFAFDNVRIYDNILYSPISAINTVDTNGVANSLGEKVKTTGSVIGVDIRGGNGLQFTLVEQTMSGHEGIHVFSGGGASGYVVNEGDSIEIIGDIGQFNGLTQIVPDSIRIIKTNAFIPTPIATSVLNESTESKWLTLSTDFVLLDPSGTTSYNMDATNGTDTITIRVDSDTDINDSLNVAGQNLVVGDTICGLLGIGGQFDSSIPYTDGYQIFPMRYSDITICRLSVGINENSSDEVSFQISPNPTEGQFTIRTSKLTSANAQLIVRDLSGKVIFKDRIINSGSGFTKTYDLSGNAKGVYFISIIDGDQLINQKLIKQ